MSQTLIEDTKMVIFALKITIFLYFTKIDCTNSNIILLYWISLTSALETLVSIFLEIYIRTVYKVFEFWGSLTRPYIFFKQLKR
jgi:hypothetical protein